MADPKIELFGAGRMVASNDNWATPAGTWAATQSQLTGVIGRVGAFAVPAGSMDAAILVTLAPGNYTAQVSGVSGASGLALVEVCEVP